MNNNIIMLLLEGPIIWQFPYDAPDEFQIAAIPGCCLINPVQYPRILDSDEMNLHNCYFNILIKDHIIISSKWIIFRSPSESDLSLKPFSNIKPFLTLLRCEARQPTIPRRFSIAKHCDLSHFDGKTRISPIFNNTNKEIYLSNIYFCNPVLIDHINQINKISKNNKSENENIPVYIDIFLDSLSAHIEQNYRTALLLAAVAVECFALNRIEADKSSMISNKANIHRVTSVSVGGGTVSTKDSIFDIISKNEDFGRLLHEIPLYLINRSLLLEYPETFRLAKKLYTTRSKIVHKGEVPKNDDHFSLDYEGSCSGLEVAVEVFRWLGDQANYCIRRGFVRLTV